jgi:hypothetical protein
MSTSGYPVRPNSRLTKVGKSEQNSKPVTPDVFHTRVMVHAKKFAAGISYTLFMILVSVSAALIQHVIPQCPSYVQGLIADDPDDRIDGMNRAFAMNANGPKMTQEYCDVEFESNGGYFCHWNGNYILKGDRLQLPLARFVQIGYDVRYDARNEIVMMRRPGAYSCIAFSCPEAGSSKVVTYWCDPNSEQWFDKWWQNLSDGETVPGARVISFMVATNPCCLKCDQSNDFYVPVRVLAAAVGSFPETEVDFLPGDSQKDSAKDATVRIHIPGTIASLSTAGVVYSANALEPRCSLNSHWSAPLFVLNKFK